jgi:hypothetical protein
MIPGHANANQNSVNVRLICGTVEVAVRILGAPTPVCTYISSHMHLLLPGIFILVFVICFN